MTTSHQLLVALLFLAVLPSCVTKAMWGDSLRTSGRTEHPVPVAAVDDTAHVSSDGTALTVVVRLPDRPALPCVLRPHADNTFATAAVLQMAREKGCWLNFVHELPHGSSGEKWTALLQAGPPGSSERLALALDVQPEALEHGRLLIGASPLPLAAVSWRTVEWAESEVDYLGITWRVAATPFTVTADIAMALPTAAVTCAAGAATAITMPLWALLMAATS